MKSVPDQAEPVRTRGQVRAGKTKNIKNKNSLNQMAERGHVQ
jgi:hypothetical protein